MRLNALSPLQKSLLTAAAAGFLALASTPSRAQNEVPNAGRLGFVSGAVSVQPAGTDDWGQAYPNLPVGPGDRIFTDADGRAEIQVGQTYVRIGANTDISVVRNDPQGIAFELVQGSIHVHSYGVWPGQAMQVGTPNANITAFSSSELRIDTAPDQSSTIFTSFGPETLIGNAPSGFQEHLENGQSLEIAGANPVYPQWLAPAPDDLDGWSMQRDRQIASSVSFRYVSPYIPGAAELDASGDWTPGTPYGAVWFPRNLPGGWAPYHYGHWVNRAPWGWTWVEDEQWGYAPFHYGRWVTIGGRWGWIPGPPAARPIYAPALVVFAGGIQVGGVGVSVWFPLGPGEAYRPWYPCPPHYVDAVNISNITETNVVHVQKTYVNIVNVINVTYVNRVTGVTAMNQSDFAAGRQAAQVSVRVAPQQLEHVTEVRNITTEVKPTRAALVGKAPTRPPAAPAARPSVAAMQKKPTTAPPPKPPAGRTPVAAPAGAKTQNAVVKNPAELGKRAPAAGKPGEAPAAPAKPAAAPPAKAAAPEAREEGKPTPPPPAHPEGKPIPPPPAKPAAPPAKAATPEAKPATPPAEKPEVKPGEKQATPPAKPATKPGTKPEDKNKKPEPEKKPE
jgi:hypothetical protein